MLFSSRGPHGFGAQAWISIMLLAQVAVALRWFFGPPPVKRDFVAFAIFGDVGTASVLVLYSPFGALVGSSLFALTGGLCTFFVSQKWMLAHLALCCGFIAAMTVLNLLAGDEDAPTVLATSLVIFAATAVVPLLAHIAWTAISRDARRSLLDPLTNLLNRRGFDDAAEALWHRGREHNFSLTVLVIDIDRFKVVNDYYGHDSGDTVIVRVADRLSLLFQEDGVVARTGGEEFVAVFAAPDAVVDERIEEVVETLYNSSDNIPITVSVGACVLASPSSMWVDGPSVINKAGRIADSMMYRAKLDGGNRSSTTKL
ncbi:GGDEF domain-containing protein [Rhodococcus sp. BP22]|uniref:GGDEF domain-containing protein n=1 Tax=Rhodococcus sp. BP22 TaxID=2758566 RepID=UPI0021BD7B66|nr:GGDEF domain-containing protein [Rhodococcus sp. BP22]